MFFLIGLTVVVVSGVVLWLWRRSRNTETEESRPPEHIDRLDTITGWTPEATRVLTLAERRAFDILGRALPDHIVFAQVPLARFIRVPTRNSYAEWLRRVGNLCVDLLVCDSQMNVFAVIELNAPGELSNERVLRRQQRMQRVLKAAKVPVHVWLENALPSVETARADLLPPVVEVRQTQAAEAPVLWTADRPTPRPDAEDTAPMPDEVIEMPEPPSTWYDDLDSGPTPLTPEFPRRESKPPR